MNWETRLQADKIELEMELRRAKLLAKLGPLPERPRTNHPLVWPARPFRFLAALLRGPRITRPKIDDDRGGARHPIRSN